MIEGKMYKSVADLLDYANKNEVKGFDFRFSDLKGVWHHITVPVKHADEDMFKDGIPFDGSSIEGWAEIDNSDMVMIPDVKSAFLDPFIWNKTIVVICDVHDPVLNTPYKLDPRSLARRAYRHISDSGVADEVYFGPEVEFFIIDDVRYEVKENEVSYYVNHSEAIWNSNKLNVDNEKNLGHHIDLKGGYLPTPPLDTLQDIRDEMCNHLDDVGIEVERHHHEVATAGQCEINFRFGNIIASADNVYKTKYVLRNSAKEYNKTVTFMPKPISGDNGSAMHVHQSLWKNGKNLFDGKEYGGLSQTALYYIGGILKHARGLAAITNPSTNSYKRLVPGYEAPVNLAYSKRNRSVSIRIPVVTNPKATRIELRFPDCTANPYLAFSAMLMAGLDGIKNKIDPGKALDKNVYAMNEKELSKIVSLPGGLKEAINELKKDYKYLLEGDVFSEEMIKSFIKVKEKEIEQLKMTPHPVEYKMYFNL